jgi:hypothetical protein
VGLVPGAGAAAAAGAAAVVAAISDWFLLVFSIFLVFFSIIQTLPSLSRVFSNAWEGATKRVNAANLILRSGCPPLYPFLHFALPEFSIRIPSDVPK